MTSNAVIRARYVFPATGDPISDGFVAIEGGRIAVVGCWSDFRGDRRRVRDLGNVAIMPGLVNAHAHLDFSDLASPLGHRGIGLPEWIRLVMEHRKRSPAAMTAAGVDESLRSGVVALGDMTQPDATPLAPALDVTAFLELIAPTAARAVRAVEAMRTWNGGSPGVRPGLGPHAPYTVRPELLDATVKESAARGIPVAMHVAESPEELEFLRGGGGSFRVLLEEMGVWEATSALQWTRPLDVLRQLAKSHRALVVHGNYLDDEEIAFLGSHAARMTVVYCPRSHDWFGHRPYPLEKLLSAGAAVALGTDGRGSSPDLSLLAEMRQVARRHPDVRGDQILRMGTLNGARALGLDAEIGSIMPGRRADLAVVALPDRDAADPHDLLFDADGPVTACFRRGVL